VRAISPTTVSTLPNGMRVACEHLPGLEFSTIGVWIDAGSRVEDATNNGVAHFLEHMNFKGTPTHSKAQLETIYEHVGAHFNAYTSRDRTAYYVKTFNKHVHETIGCVADVLRNSLIRPHDVEAERGTILAEMREVEELVDEVIMDNLHLSAFDQSFSGLPYTILGPTENINSINRDTIVSFRDTHYTGPRMVMVSSGGLSHEEVEALATKYFGTLPSHSNRPVVQARYTGGDYKMWNSQMATSHAAWAFPICGASDPDSVVIQLLQHVVGTYKRDDRDLFSHLACNADRSKSAEVEGVQPFYTPYEDCGLWGMYVVTMPSSPKSTALIDTVQATFREMMQLSIGKLPAATLDSAKATFKAQQLIMIDSTTNSAEDIGRQMLACGGRMTMVDLFERVDAITNADIERVLQKYFRPNRPVLSVIGNASTLPSYDMLLHNAFKVEG
jgi:mitochondrial-processing peptidase subunit beta